MNNNKKTSDHKRPRFVPTPSFIAITKNIICLILLLVILLLLTGCRGNNLRRLSYNADKLHIHSLNKCYPISKYYVDTSSTQVQIVLAPPYHTTIDTTLNNVTLIKGDCIFCDA